MSIFMAALYYVQLTSLLGQIVTGAVGIICLAIRVSQKERASAPAMQVCPRN